MHPKALLDACAELVQLALRFEHPADSVVSRYFREHRSLGPRERATLAETVYTVLRKKLLFEHLAPSGSGPKERRLAILGFHGPRDFLKSALTEQEKKWLDQCDSVQPGDLMEHHRHNLPDWLVQPLKDQLGDEFWPLVESLSQSGTLDLRVNTFTDKRADVRKELAAAGIQSTLTPYSPWGLRIEGKPALTKLDAFARGAIEVQDEGSQLLALLLEAGRGEMVVDFCAGAGGKTLAVLPHAPQLGATGWLLKMHGSVDRPRDIVLTRRDYMRYDEQRAALAGIVQAQLITKQMLFVGFSMNDANFLRIADAVRRALRAATPTAAAAGLEARPRTFGVALSLSRNPLLEELWRNDLDWVAMEDAPEGQTGAPLESARRLDIFLDYLLAQASSTSAHLLDHRFDGVLSPAERALRVALESFLAAVPPAAHKAPAWAEVEALVRRLGGLPLGARRQLSR